MSRTKQKRPSSFATWRQQFHDDCELHERPFAFGILGDTLLRMLWESGLDPTVESVLEGVCENKPN